MDCYFSKECISTMTRSENTPRWIPATASPGEAERLATLQRYEILDSPPEPAFDRVTRVAARALEAPIALVSLVDDSRQWFKARHGLDASCTGRDESFCAYTILLEEDKGEDLFIVPDAARDSRFADNPLVTSAPHIRFYAGARLRTADGWNLGSLCIIDTVPRNLSESERSLLSDLGHLTMDLIEGHHAIRRAGTLK